MTLQLKSKESVIGNFHLIKNVWKKQFPTIYHHYRSDKLYWCRIQQLGYTQKGGLYHTRSRSVLQEAVDTHDTKLFTVYLHASRVGMLHVFIYPNFFFHTKIHNHLINHLHCMLNNTGHGWLVWSKHLTFQIAVFKTG